MLRSISAPGTLKAPIDPKLQKCYNYTKSKKFRLRVIRTIIISRGIFMTDTVDGVPTDVAEAPIAPEMAKAATDDLMSALNSQADQSRRYYEKLAKQIKQVADNATQSTVVSTKGNNMAEILNPSGMMMTGGGDGGLGFGGGGGLIGGLILGSLLRQGQGGLFGGGGDAAGTAMLRSPPEQAAANMALMQSIGAVDKSVAVNAATFEASQATQSLGLTNQFNNITASLANRVDGVKDAVNANAMVLAQQLNQLNTNMLTGFNDTQKVVVADGTATRALITSQYELNLQRELATAQNEIIELRNENRLNTATNGINVTNTNNINQMQQQSQQQQQYGQLANMIWGLGQSIRSTNEAINVGSGTLTANPANTNTNIR